MDRDERINHYKKVIRNSQKAKDEVAETIEELDETIGRLDLDLDFGFDPIYDAPDEEEMQQVRDLISSSGGDPSVMDKTLAIAKGEDPMAKIPEIARKKKKPVTKAPKLPGKITRKLHRFI